MRIKSTGVVNIAGLNSVGFLQSNLSGDLTTAALTNSNIVTALGFTPYNATNPNGYISSVPAQTFASLTGKPTTLSGYGITDAYPLSGNPSNFLTSVPAQSFASLTGKPTTLSGYGITDAVANTVTVNGHALSGNVSVTKTDLSLGNVDNTSDASKPVSTAQQTALDLKANIISPSFTTPALGTPSSGNLANCTFPTLNQNTSGNAATVTTNANMTGDVTSVGNVTTLGTNKVGSAYLTSAFTTSSVTAVSTNLTFAIAANTSYSVDITGTCSKAVSATGLKFAIAAPAGCTITGYQSGGAALLATPLVPSLISAINTLGTTCATGIGVTVAFELHFVVVNSSTAGNITLQCATVTSNTATVGAGTKMTWTKATGL
jgi:hypothetical protein